MAVRSLLASLSWSSRLLSSPRVLQLRFTQLVLLQTARMSDVAVASTPATEEQPPHGIKRPWEDRTEEDNAKRAALDGDDSQEKKERVKLKKYVLLMSYLGKGYLGMQRNPGMKTIEEDLLVALKKANLISEEAFETPQVIQFQRAARTDKGVSAARQIVNLKLPVAEDLVDRINEHLPEFIRVQGTCQVTKRFNSKTFCCARTYSYTLPTFALAPVTELTTASYRVTSEVIASLNTTLSKFVGTHNFHNFTAKRKHLDPSAQRYIMSMECGQPFERDGLELVRLVVKGQSFMLHQIRKMVGVAVAIARGMASEDVVDRAWGEDRVDIPIAPGLGLVLEQVHYDKYNMRFGADGLHAPLTWTSEEEKVKEFVDKYILSAIVQAEKEEKSMFSWLETLPFHSYDVRDESTAVNLTPLGKAARKVELLRGAGSESDAEESDGGGS